MYFVLSWRLAWCLAMFWDFDSWEGLGMEEAVD